jgi:alpha-amylase/alpha-mannosidase (GH57 family)
MTARNLQVVLCWHMHQPQYRSPVNGRYLKPWTWLHGIKDYTDMAAHLETVPGAKAVVNFSTILLEQLSDYAVRIERWGETGEPIGDPLLDALAGNIPDAGEERQALTAACLHAHEAHMVDAFPPYASLFQRAETALAEDAPLDDASLRDLLVWYHLAWTGESLRREQPLVRELQQKAGGFALDDGRQLLTLIGEVLAGLIPRYRRLAESGRVELSLTPHAHPILPLLIDHASALEAMPDAALPAAGYPGGVDRCRWHLERALSVFERHFGFRPAGCWPSEGGISEAVVPLLDEFGFKWTATGTNVLRNSLGGGAEIAHLQHWQAARDRYGLACFFRDDELSDRIGFQYSSWDAEHAVEDLIERLDTIRRDWSEPTPPLVAIIMDGENAWEHYPYNAWYFLQHLYSRLSEHPQLELTTFKAALEHGHARTELPRFVAGSWVYGNFAVWIGDPLKNYAWELLAAAKQCVDRALGAAEPPDAATREAILEQLGVCEGSDWFWWLGADNRPEDSIEFDSLFREHLKALYRLLDVPPPANLDIAVEPGAASGDAGSMRRANQ